MSQCRFINMDSNLFASNSVYSYCDNNPAGALDPHGQDAIWITSSERVPIWGHTALLIEYEGEWRYCKFAQNGIVKRIVPDQAMSSLEAFNKHLKTTKTPYDSCTYIFGDFTESFEYFDALPSNYYKNYSIITNNCMTMSWKLISMGTAADGSSIEDVMHDAFWASDGAYGICNTCIPNHMVNNVKYTFANDQFTAAEAKNQIVSQYARIKKQQDSWIGWMFPSQTYTRFRRLIGVD